MKYRHFASFLPLVLVLGGAPLRAQDAAPADAGAAPAAAPAKAPKTELAKDMDKVNRAFRKLRTQISDSTKNDSTLQLLGALRDAAEAAGKETPAKAADLPPADQDKFNADYQSKLKDFLTAVDAVIADVKGGDNATAATDLKKLAALEHDDHKEFRKPEKEDNK